MKAGLYWARTAENGADDWTVVEIHEGGECYGIGGEPVIVPVEVGPQVIPYEHAAGFYALLDASRAVDADRTPLTMDAFYDAIHALTGVTTPKDRDERVLRGVKVSVPIVDLDLVEREVASTVVRGMAGVDLSIVGPFHHAGRHAECPGRCARNRNRDVHDQVGTGHARSAAWTCALSRRRRVRRPARPR